MITNNEKWPNTDYNKLEHLKLIESIISRLAGNAHNIKVLTITLIVAIFTFAGRNPNLSGKMASILIALLVAAFFR